MGFYYFLGLALGIGLLLYGISQSSKRAPYRKIILLMAGTALVGISLFMFTPESADIVARLLGI